MATISEVVAAVVVQSSAAAFSHFGVTLEPTRLERSEPVAERVVARTPRRAQRISLDCPEAQRARVLKA